ncbi:MAG: hypothetical protein ACMXYG_06935 [Candidatus Woesearchaeota archaeon]
MVKKEESQSNIDSSFNDGLTEKRIISPLNSSFMLTSMVGFLVTVFYLPTFINVFPEFETGIISFIFAFALIFVLMFIASLISMTYSPVSEHLQIDEKRKIKFK